MRVLFSILFIMLYTDKQLFRLCRKYGTAALQARRKFMGLLPEVQRRRLYEKKGYFSIYEFAAKLAGLSRDQVQRVLQLERRLEDKPVLQQLLVSGEISHNKLVRIAAIATAENQAVLAEKVRNLSQNAVETWVRDLRGGGGARSGGRAQSVECKVKSGGMNGVDGFLEPETTDESVRAQRNFSNINQDIRLMSALSVEVKEKLLEMAGKGLDINEILLELLAKRDSEIQTRKEIIAEKLREKTAKKFEDVEVSMGQKELVMTPGKEVGREPEIENIADDNKPAPSRYIPVAVKNILKEEFGDKCAGESCHRLADDIHHKRRFSANPSHDPRSLLPVCSGHHELAHADEADYRRYKYR